MRRLLLTALLLMSVSAFVLAQDDGTPTKKHGKHKGGGGGGGECVATHTGTLHVWVMVAMAKGGKKPTVTLDKSSGDDCVDQKALAAVRGYHFETPPKDSFSKSKGSGDVKKFFDVAFKSVAGSSDVASVPTSTTPKE